MFRIASKTRRRLGRLYRGTAWFALVQYCVLCTGLPLPAASPPPSGDSASQNYPCRDHRCGCATAEQCWRSCCCYSRDEKLAWARTRGMTPPAYVIAEPETRSASSRTPVRKSCCAHGCSSVEAPQTDFGEAAEPATEWVSYLAAAKCRGVAATAWLNVPISVPVVAIDATVRLTNVDSMILSTEPVWASVSFAPAEPPPRIV